MKSRKKRSNKASTLINIADFEREAERVLSRSAFDYFHGGAADEITLAENESAFMKYRLRPRMLREIGTRDLSTTILGEKIQFPALIAPIAFHRLAHSQGEKATARAAQAAGTLMIVSVASTISLEEIAEQTQGPTLVSNRAL